MNKNVVFSYTEDSREDVGGAIKICIEAIRNMEEYNR